MDLNEKLLTSMRLERKHQRFQRSRNIQKEKEKEAKWDSTDIMHTIVVNKLLIKNNQLLS